MKILISGAGCAGPALAFWLSRTHHQVIIVERSPSLRDKGAQIDLREQGIEVVRRMGLLETIRQHCVHEDGFTLVDGTGHVTAKIRPNTSGQGAQSFSSEFEIMRGDLVRILYDATKDNVEYRFNTSVERFEQDDQKVTVYFSTGTSETFDLLVGADGQGSRIRRDAGILPPDAADPYRRLGIHAAYWFVPREKGDTNTFTAYVSPGGRAIFRRSHSPTMSQVYFMLKDDDPALASVHRASVDAQKEFWIQRYRGAGWQTERFVEGMRTTDNFYSQEIVQVKMERWYKGRVVLLGDAAACPAVVTGMGTTGCLVGAYVLAGEINRHAGDGDVGMALRNYEKTLRPFVKEIQKLNTSVVRLFFPTSWWGICILHWFAAVVCFLRIPELLDRLGSKEVGGWKLPEYEELYAVSSS
ncbi:hypothetical protein ASPBRDRAFT_132949 [Aspergillus brasiliensis CBS 101740]|uniref:FAD-binding domain-containing protein n=1 Tax=Aspergillus brasiliensis (strain CBS 101740 / IMI 381727 / IBT 21946) TaxID=767769 RepID=A0A1L9U9R3_ASPBC|nr:hypothetical protein ASPBRDRAFT_132949 [Aspergillus brasiliensis CBS 101740]